MFDLKITIIALIITCWGHDVIMMSSFCNTKHWVTPPSGWEVLKEASSGCSGTAFCANEYWPGCVGGASGGHLPHSCVMFWSFFSFSPHITFTSSNNHQEHVVVSCPEDGQVNDMFSHQALCNNDTNEYVRHCMVLVSLAEGIKNADFKVY